MSLATCTYSAKFFNGRYSRAWKFTIFFLIRIFADLSELAGLLPYIIVKTSSVSFALLCVSEWHYIWIKVCFMNSKFIRYLTVYILSSNDNSAYLEMFRNFVCCSLIMQHLFSHTLLVTTPMILSQQLKSWKTVNLRATESTWIKYTPPVNWRVQRPSKIEQPADF